MKVAIFRVSSSIESASLEDSVNSFLAKLPDNAVNHVNTSTSATRIGPETDQMETEIVITIWYDDRFLV